MKITHFAIGVTIALLAWFALLNDLKPVALLLFTTMALFAAWSSSQRSKTK